MTTAEKVVGRPGFLVPPVLEPYGDVFRLANVPVYRGSDGDVWTLARASGVPWVTDFATVPRVAVWLIPRFGKFTLAAIVHDWFCAIGILLGAISSRDADGVFRQILRIEGVSFLSRWLAWTGVRWASIFNEVRRDWPDFFRDLPKMLPFTLIGLVLLFLPAIFITVSLALFGALQFLISLCLRDEKTTTGVDATT